MKSVRAVVSRYSTALCLDDAKVGLRGPVRAYEEVPGPRPLPLLGNAWRFLPFVGHYQLNKLDQITASLHQQYGDIVSLRGLIGHPDLVFVFNPQEIERVFKREEVLPHRPSMPTVKYYKTVMHKNFFGDDLGVVGVHGEKWDRFRSQVQQTMMQPSTAKKYVGPLDGITTEFLHRIENRRLGGDHPEDFIEELYRWALECIGKVALDTRLGCLDGTGQEAQQMIESVKMFFANVANVELRLPVWKLVRTPAFNTYINAFDMFRLTCLKYIEEAMKKMEGQSDNRLEGVLHEILTKTRNPKVATVLALDLLLVGIDTTSVAATTIIYHLAKNPEKQQLVFEQLNTILPDPEQPLTNEILSKATYLSACIKESLRIKPVIIGNGRSLQSDAEIGGYMVPKGTHIIFPHYVVGNMPEYFPQPDRFVPERWLKSAAGCPLSSKIHRFASLPFGYGRRTCLGRRFAEIELKILLSKIFRSYHVSYDGIINYEVQSTYKPSHPVRFHFEKRSNGS